MNEALRSPSQDRPSPPAVSVIATVFEEAGAIDRLIRSLAGQTRRPDELVIVDGGSRDGTLERLQDWAGGELRLADGTAFEGLRVISEPGANISAGRNRAIEEAQGPVIAVTDAGVSLVDDWLEIITAPFAEGARIVSGFFASDPEGAFELALGAVTLPEREEIDPRSFLPSSRSVAFLKSDWAAIGGYPEWLDYCEDLVFDFRLIDRAGQPTFAPAALARFQPRPSLGAFWTQYYRYARGDGKSGLWAGRHAIRYLTYGLLAPLVIIAAVLLHPAAWGLLAAGGLAMLRRPLRRLTRQWSVLEAPQKLAALAWLAPIRLTGDLAKMAGYPVGLAWRRRHRPPEWRPRKGLGRL